MKRKMISGVLAVLLMGSLFPVQAAAKEPMVLHKQNTFSSRKGGECVFYYDEQGNCVREEWKDAFDYDLSSDEAEERVVEYAYDNSGVLMRKTVHDEGKLSWIVEYDVHGHEETVTAVDEKGKKTILREYTNTYDDQDRLTARSWEGEEYKEKIHYSETYTYFDSKEQGKALAGQEVTFGRFRQSGKEETPITWIVLEVKGGEALLLSKYALDCRPYHEKETSVTWHTSDLYDWLNNEFYQQAFDEDEKLFVEETDDSPYDNPERVFLLSLEEVNQYFSNNKERICQATDYAVNHNAYVNPSTGGSWWWLRTKGGTAKEALSIYSDGRIDTQGDRVNGERGVVRPAILVRLGGLKMDASEADAVQTYTYQEFGAEEGELKRERTECYDIRGNHTYLYEKAYDWTNYDYFDNTYDASGRLTFVEIKRTTEEQQKDKLVCHTINRYGEITYTYDDAGRLIGKEGRFDTGGMDHELDSWEYDNQGNLVHWEGSYGFGDYTYVPLSKALWKE